MTSPLPSTLRGIDVAPDVISLIGNTPLVALQRLSPEGGPVVMAKMEMMNPGGSVKDRIGLRLIEAAEASGDLKPGGTIVEPTSGNTGVGLAMAAALRGYRCQFVLPDKVAPEKIALLQAYGAETFVCPTAVEPDDPESYYSVSDRLAAQPGAFKLDQYSNPANPAAHEATTGPELWEQTKGRITHFVAGVGTGGTITGAGRYLKEQNPNIQIVGVDIEGSLYTGDAAHTYLVEGIGEDFFPETLDMEIIDRWERTGDAESFEMAARCGREEGILVGGSCGSAILGALRVAADAAADAVIVVLLPDSGRGYLSKFYDNNWRSENDLPPLG